MRNFWSCTKFADTIRGTKKPEYGTSEEWREWEKTAKEDHPVRYWIAEELLDKVQSFLYYPLDKLHDIKYWFLNRFVTKTHALTSNLNRGEYYDLDTRIIHCLFDELVNFVEVEKAWLHVCWNVNAREKYKAPGWSFGPFRTRTWRCPQAGIDYLEWEINSEDTRDTLQAENAKEILELYYWWKNIYLKRPDPMDISGWSAYCEKNPTPWDHDVTDESDKIVKELRRIEAEYEKEEDEMMMKLVKIRRSLWT